MSWKKYIDDLIRDCEFSYVGIFDVNNGTVIAKYGDSPLNNELTKRVIESINEANDANAARRCLNINGERYMKRPRHCDPGHCVSFQNRDCEIVAVKSSNAFKIAFHNVDDSHLRSENAVGKISEHLEKNGL